MANSNLNEKVKTDEFSKIFDEYRSKIGEITRRPDQEQPATGNKLETRTEEVEEKASPSEMSRATEEKEKTPLESASIVNQARRQAQQIIFEAEESAREEARKRTRQQVDKILKKAEQDAEEIVQSTRLAAERERKEMLDTVQQQSESIIREITETARRDTEARSSQILGQAQEKASKMMSDIAASSSKISHGVVDIVEQARKSVKDFETKMQAETEALIQAVTDSQTILDKVAESARDAAANSPATPATGPAPAQSNQPPIQKPTLKVTLKGDTTTPENGGQPLFNGLVEMKSVSESFESQYLKGIKKYLTGLPAVKYLQDSASEEETSVLFEVREPLPLFDVLSNIPMAEEVVTGAKGMSVVFQEPEP